ncbi:multicopper oxidase domain-containing protein [Arthrobacter sp. ISL-65]|uniref:multicopper oxidase domain-containing protein n=1 Tax=Arthrobacter sp. ISL-65 TaxID=2819112 RepID=UPI002035F81A|nr:multicopper oxidase domain-containing protein [Arthrobacter sp. ISL-65]
MSPLDLHVNDGYLPMVDGTLVYHRGYGDRPTAVKDPKPSLFVSPRVFRRNGSVVASRTYPLSAAVPPKGRPAPAAKDPANPGQFLVHRARWASFFPDRTLIAETGSTISIRVTNHLAQDHALQFLHAGAANVHVGTGAIKPGQTKTLTFKAPAEGTYLYCDPGADPADPTADPVQRTLGLFGALLVVNPDSSPATLPLNGRSGSSPWQFPRMRRSTGRGGGHADVRLSPGGRCPQFQPECGSRNGPHRPVHAIHRRRRGPPPAPFPR